MSDNVKRKVWLQQTDTPATGDHKVYVVTGSLNVVIVVGVFRSQKEITAMIDDGVNCQIAGM